MMSYIGISQDLVPEVQKIYNETYFCFTIGQSKVIATLLEQGKYDDSLVRSLTMENWRFRLLTQKKDSLIGYKNIQLSTYEKIHRNDKKTMALLKQTIKIKDQKIRRSRLQKTGIGIGAALLVLTSLLISN